MSKLIFFISFFVVTSAVYCTAVTNQVISAVRVSTAVFNPSSSERLDIVYQLGSDDKISLNIYDLDGGLVAALLQAASRRAGEQKETWNGRDDDGKIVPDEAYTFTVETTSGAVYDPTTFSGGVVGDITDVRFDREAGTAAYNLPAPARVLIRLGIQNGPMLRTLVDWKPRAGGSIAEPWDGLDESGVIKLQEQKNFSGIITYVTLPATTVITYGNTNETYREYKLGRGTDRPQKPKRARTPDQQMRMPPEGLVPPAWARSPVVSLTFPKNTNSAVPAVSSAIDVRVDVAEADKDELLKGQFEVMFFMDNVFFAEAERGYLPYNWRWELNQLPEGDHMLTVNLSSFKGQVGVANRKVKVIKPSK